MSKSYVSEYFNSDSRMERIFQTNLRKAEEEYNCPFQDFNQQQTEEYANRYLTYKSMQKLAQTNSSAFRSFSYRFRKLLKYLDWLCDQGYITEKTNQMHPIRALYKSVIMLRTNVSDDTSTRQSYNNRSSTELRNTLFFSLDEYKAYCHAIFPIEDTNIHIRAVMDLLWLGLTIENLRNLERDAFHDGEPGEAYIEYPDSYGQIQIAKINDPEMLSNIRHLVQDKAVVVTRVRDNRVQNIVSQFEDSNYLVRSIRYGKAESNTETRKIRYVIHLAESLNKRKKSLDADSPWREKKISVDSLRISGKFCALEQSELSLEEKLQEANKFMTTCSSLYSSIKYTDWLELV